MAKDKISDYSSTANSNTDIAGINIDEGCAPSGINDAIRTLMAQLKTWQSGGQDIYIHPAGSASAPSITATGDTNTGVFFPAADTVGITTGGTERARVDSSGNLGLGVTPSAWQSTRRALQVGATSSVVDISGNTYFGNNYYNDSSGTAKYIANGVAFAFGLESDGGYKWYRAGSGTAGGTVSFTQAMTLDASSSLGVANTSPTRDSSTHSVAIGNNSKSASLDLYGTSRNFAIFSGGSGQLGFYDLTAGAERARIDSSGNLLVGTTSGTVHTIFKNVTSDAGQEMLNVSNCAGFRRVSNFTFSSANTAIVVGKDSSTNRSINAAGSVNASGADYAEYMTKCGDFTVAKGAVVGIDAQGKLTNVFTDAVSFAVKSTAPSYVGGDVWGIGFEDDAEGLEAARQLVDRIAFAGQVPVNVIGATSGQYIIPINDNGSIKGEAVSNPTFEQYQQAVGKVIAIEQDGRARIIVKVA